VPKTLGLCTDVAVNEAPFYVMDFVDGLVVDSADKAKTLARDVRYAAGIDLIDVLADLHAVDVDAVGLGDLARRDAYIERQLKRWAKQWEASKTRELAAIDEVEKGLRAHMPEQQGVSIVHGDFRLGNCLTDPSSGRIAAVLDWELCTLGDPLADVGYLGVSWTDEGNPPRRGNDATVAGGFPSYATIVERYAERTGRDVSRVAYYTAFSSWRLAVIVEGVYARYLHGQMADKEVDINTFKSDVERLSESALEAVRSLA
jgi:aminoglycoside phosphotransferase (APT) family kinase protein